MSQHAKQPRSSIFPLRKVFCLVLWTLTAALHLVGCGDGFDGNESQQGASLAAAAALQICATDVNVRDASLENVVEVANLGDRVGKIDDQSLLGPGHSFMHVRLPRLAISGWVATDLICAAQPAGGAGALSRKIRVILSQNRLEYFEDGKLIRGWNVGTARAGKVTPTGKYRILLKEKCPPYFGAEGDKNIAGCSSQNPLGTRALWFIDTMYGLHGTNAPNLIATGTTAGERRLSGGCIRNQNANIEWLYERAKVGDPVEIVY